MSNSIALPKKSIILMLVWCLTYTCAVSCVKLLDNQINIFVIVLIRSLFGLIYVLPWTYLENKYVLKPQHPILLLIRSLFSCLALCCSYYAYTHLSLALATSIGLTVPFVIAILAQIILKDKISYIQWISITIGYLGVLIMFPPVLVEINSGLVAALCASFFAGCFIIITKIISKSEKTITIMFYTTLYSIIFTGLLTILSIVIFNSNFSVFTQAHIKPYWLVPSTYHFLVLMLIGGFATFSQFIYILAIKHTSPSLLAPFEYTRLIMAIAIDFAFFNEVVALSTIIGSIIIIASNYLVAITKKSYT